MTEPAAITLAKKYLKAVEEFDAEALTALLSPQVRQVEYPNMIAPKGAQRGLAELLEGLEKGRALLRRQENRISTLTGDDHHAVAEFVWEGELAVPLGPKQPGDRLIAHCVAVFDIADGLVIGQRHYDCFEPLDD